MKNSIKKSVIAAGLTLSLGLTSLANNAEAKFDSNIQAAKTEYVQGNYHYEPYMQQYSPTGDYLNASLKSRAEVPGRMLYDGNGIPMVKYNQKFSYNPVTACNAALSMHGKYIQTKNETYKQRFLNLADGLMLQQSKDGAFRYTFRFNKPELGAVLKPGWVSAMAQGEALSVYSRAYQLTGDVKYLNAGKAAFNFLQVSKAKGGVMTDLGDISVKLKGYIWFEEYVTPKNNYTLNGYMFTLLGIYDWSQLNVSGDYGKDRAKVLFSKGIASLKQVLRRYDLGGYTTYDLSYYTMHLKKPHIVAGYHAVHIYQLQALYSVTGEKYLLNKSQTWATYVD